LQWRYAYGIVEFNLTKGQQDLCSLSLEFSNRTAGAGRREFL
jgi:hypothetical protein